MNARKVYRLLLLTCLQIWGVLIVYAHIDPTTNSSSKTIKLIENKGQWDREVLFKASIPGGDVFITAKGLVYALIDEQQLHKLNHADGNKRVNAHNYRMLFAGCNSARVTVERGNAFSEYYNYFIGDKSKWASRCKAYDRVVLRNIYRGIDAEIIAHEDYLKLNFRVDAGADISLIKLTYEGQDSLVLKDKALLVNTSVAVIKEDIPLALQHNKEIACSYQLERNNVSFNLGAYDHTQPLVIDPNIVFGTFSGSIADNFGYTATYDYLGNGYAGGTVFSNGFPVTYGAFQINFDAGGSKDAGILKFSSDGTRLLYATYLGGNADEQPHSIVCNSAGDLYILGTTNSTTFPTTESGFDRSHNGNYDIFISCLSADGSTLKHSTYWGGTQNDGINGRSVTRYLAASPLSHNYGDSYRGSILLDKNENVCVASVTESYNGAGYPISNAFQPAFGGGNQDACVFQMTPDLSFARFSTYLGGTGDDAAYSIAIDPFNSIFVCGGTQSPNIGKFQGALTYKGGVDAFVAKIGPLGSSLQKLVYVGTAAYDQAYFIDIDSKYNVFITGQTEGSNFPIKGAVYTDTKAKQFITSLNNNLDSIRVSTVFGAPNQNFPGLSPSAFMVDQCDHIYFSGWGGATNNGYNSSTGSTLNFTITPGAFQSTTDGSDFYLAVFATDLKQLSYATYFGGSLSNEHVDGGTSRFDKRGIIYQSVCAGCGGYSDFPTTPDAYSRVNNGKRPNNPTLGGCNNALFKFSLNPSDLPPGMLDTFLTIHATDTLKYTMYAMDPDGDSVRLSLSGNIFSILNNPPTVTIGKGPYYESATLSWNTLCSHVSSDTIVINTTAADNACPTPNISRGRIKLLVTPPPVLPSPYPQCLQTINDSTVVIKWNSIGKMKYFKRYNIYRKTENTPYVLYASDSVSTDTQFIDTKAYNHLTSNYCYYIQTVNTCDSASPPSRNICSLFQNDTNQVIFIQRDTLLRVFATDTLSYTFTTESINPLDSVFISVGGNLLTTNRMLSAQYTFGLQKATYTFTWRSVCDDLNQGSDTLKLQLLVRDNQCPQSRTQKATVNIIVIPPPTDKPPVMQCTRSTGTNSTLVRWNNAPPRSRYFKHYVLVRKNVNGTWEKLDTFNVDSVREFQDNASVNNQQQNICYAIYAVNTCGLAGDTSDLSCTVVKNVSPPAPVYIYSTTVKNNKNIHVCWQRSKEADFYQYTIFKKDESNSGYKLLSTLSNIDDTTLTDDNVNVHQSAYCYELKQVNDCGLSNTNAFHSCSILLKGVSKPFAHYLEWNEYDYWKNGLDQYLIVRQEPNQEAVALGTTHYKSTHTVDNTLNIENGLYYYTIEASENNSLQKSTSNTIELVQSPLLHVPNAFTPNHDNLNDYWQPVPVFVKDYHLKLFNRWGQLIFETTNKHHVFDNEFMNDPTTCDVFVYLITYTGWDGSSHVVKDNVTLLK